MSLPTTARTLSNSVQDTVDHLQTQASDLLDTAHHKADQALAKVAGKVDDLSVQGPGLLDLASARVQQAARKSASFAKDVGHAAKAKANDYADQASSRIRKDPLKSVLIAAAAGAAVTAVAVAAYKRRSGK